MNGSLAQQIRRHLLPALLQSQGVEGSYARRERLPPDRHPHVARLGS